MKKTETTTSELIEKTHSDINRIIDINHKTIARPPRCPRCGSTCHDDNWHRIGQ